MLEDRLLTVLEDRLLTVLEDTLLAVADRCVELILWVDLEVSIF